MSKNPHDAVAQATRTLLRSQKPLLQGSLVGYSTGELMLLVEKLKVLVSSAEATLAKTNKVLATRAQPPRIGTPSDGSRNGATGRDR
jgi:hypothetical protein